MSKLEIEESRHTTPNGREFIQFTPVLRPDCCAKGILSFACWQCWADEPITHERARTEALANARHVLRELATL